MRDKERVNVEVYDVNAYRLQRCLTVPNAQSVYDITSCEHYHCLYIGDPSAECVHRLDRHGAATRWPVNDFPLGLSVNAAHNVIVTCPDVRKIKEFSSHGKLLRELTLPDDVINPWHTIQSRSGQFIVCRGPGDDEGEGDDPINRVCMISADGRHIVHSHGGRYCMSFHLAVDDNECVYVVYIDNWRSWVTLLSPTLNYLREVVTSDKLKGCPFTLYLDVQRRRLYVADNDTEDDDSMGRVVVFSV